MDETTSDYGLGGDGRGETTGRGGGGGNILAAKRPVILQSENLQKLGVLSQRHCKKIAHQFYILCDHWQRLETS